ncbi:hypothetical protein HDV05_006463 [Chytridiales sp. JEL 0842]|nr:hypothetical protein HDV05_006463 [Chytridiales sp. JEL 0842]
MINTHIHPHRGSDPIHPTLPKYTTFEEETQSTNLKSPTSKRVTIAPLPDEPESHEATLPGSVVQQTVRSHLEKESSRPVTDPMRYIEPSRYALAGYSRPRSSPALRKGKGAEAAVIKGKEVKVPSSVLKKRSVFVGGSGGAGDMTKKKTNKKGKRDGDGDEDDASRSHLMGDTSLANDLEFPYKAQSELIDKGMLGTTHGIDHYKFDHGLIITERSKSPFLVRPKAVSTEARVQKLVSRLKAKEVAEKDGDDVVVNARKLFKVTEDFMNAHNLKRREQVVALGGFSALHDLEKRAKEEAAAAGKEGAKDDNNNDDDDEEDSDTESHFSAITSVSGALSAVDNSATTNGAANAGMISITEEKEDDENASQHPPSFNPFAPPPEDAKDSKTVRPHVTIKEEVDLDNPKSALKSGSKPKRAVQVQHVQEDPELLHQMFMKRVEKCVLRPASAKLTYANSGSGHQPAGGTTASAAAKYRPRSAPTSQNHADGPDGPTGSGGVGDAIQSQGITSTPNPNKTGGSRTASASNLSKQKSAQRPTSAPQHPSKHPPIPIPRPQTSISTYPNRTPTSRPTTAASNSSSSRPPRPHSTLSHCITSSSSFTPHKISLITPDQATVIRTYFHKKMLTALPGDDISHYKLQQYRLATPLPLPTSLSSPFSSGTVRIEAGTKGGDAVEFGMNALTLSNLERGGGEVWDNKAFSVQKFIKDYFKMEKSKVERAHAQRELLRRQQAGLASAGGGGEWEGAEEGVREQQQDFINQGNPIVTLEMTLEDELCDTTCNSCGSYSHSTAHCPLEELLLRPQTDPDAPGRAFYKSLMKPLFDRSAADKKRIFNVLRPFKACEKLSDYLLGEVCGVVCHIQYEKDEVVFYQGDVGTAWFIILSGSVAIKKSATGRFEDSKTMLYIKKGEGFGDLALVNDAPRTASIQAAERTELLRVEKDDFNRIMKFIKAKEVSETYNFLKKIPVFKDWPKLALSTVGANMRTKIYGPGQIIYSQDMELGWIYFIKSGTVTVQKTSNFQGRPEPVIVGTLQPLDYFGEESVHTSTPKPLARTTMIAGDVKKMPREFLKAQMAKGPVPMTLTAGSHNFTTVPSNGCEVLYLSLQEARDHLRHTLEMGHLTVISEKEIEAAQRYAVEMRRWGAMRKKEMDRLVKERFADPNVDIKAVRKRGGPGEIIIL